MFIYNIYSEMLLATNNVDNKIYVHLKCKKSPICNSEFSSSLFSGREKKTLKRNVEIALWDKEKKNKKKEDVDRCDKEM